MPQMAAYSGRKLILVRLFSTENRDICVNLVMPVMNTNCSYSSSAFNIANTSLYVAVHSSCCGVFQEC